VSQKLVFSKWREALGGNLKGIATAAVLVRNVLLRAFNAAGVMVHKGYGLTGAAPGLGSMVSDPNTPRTGTVGSALEDITSIRIEPSSRYNPGEGKFWPNSRVSCSATTSSLRRRMIRVIDGERWLVQCWHVC
jgi:long-chain acyl-CoA synthetase